MATVNESLLLKFRDKDTRFGVTRGTVKALASELDVTETQVVHLALSKLAETLLPAYERDDAPLTAQQRQVLRRDARARLPKGKLLDRKDLFG
jgi:hypothetical protein